MNERNDTVDDSAQQQDDQSTQQVEPPRKDVVDEASLESFPASDPPGWATGQHRSRARKRDARRRQGEGTLPEE